MNVCRGGGGRRALLSRAERGVRSGKIAEEAESEIGEHGGGRGGGRGKGDQDRNCVWVTRSI